VKVQTNSISHLSMFKDFVRRDDWIGDLTPKESLSLRGTNEILGRYLRAEFMFLFFETFFEDRKIDKLCRNIIFFQLVPGTKVMPK